MCIYMQEVRYYTTMFLNPKEILNRLFLCSQVGQSKSFFYPPPNMPMQSTALPPISYPPEFNFWTAGRSFTQPSGADYLTSPQMNSFQYPPMVPPRQQQQQQLYTNPAPPVNNSNNNSWFNDTYLNMMSNRFRQPPPPTFENTYPTPVVTHQQQQQDCSSSASVVTGYPHSGFAGGYATATAVEDQSETTTNVKRES